MLILATDTSGKYGSIALGRFEDAEHGQVLEITPLEGGTFSAQLIPQISALLSKHGFSKSDVDAFAVASGPGSFTGLRVGLAAVKALAEVLARPVAAVSLLEVVAAAKSEAGAVAALDGGRSEIYCRTREGEERLLTGPEFLVVAKGGYVVTPDRSIAELAGSAGVRVHEIKRPDSGDIARLGYQKIQRGETITPEALDANYIRRTDAELFTKPGV